MVPFTDLLPFNLIQKIKFLINSEMKNWTHRFELKIPNSKHFYHYEYHYIPVSNGTSHSGTSQIKNDPFNTMAMFMGLPKNEFGVTYPIYNFSAVKNGILKTDDPIPATLIYHDDFFVPEGVNGYAQNTIGMSLNLNWRL